MSHLSDSNITKRALAHAFKALLRLQPFEKISVGEICEACELNRKSFYYHFKDKYDLIQWIFQTEFISAMGSVDAEDRWSFLSALCAYFERERDFYVKILRISGQNSFRQYFAEYLFQAAEPFLGGPLPEDENYRFLLTFLRDAILMAVIRWLEESPRVSATEFVDRLRYISEQMEAQARYRLEHGGET